MQVCDDVLAKYARLIVQYGVNIQAGQLLHITSETTHLQLARLIVEEAYKAKAVYVNVDLIDPVMQLSRYLHSTDEGISFVPGFLEARFNELTDCNGAVLRLDGSDYPEILSSADTRRVNAARSALRQAAKRFYADGVERARMHWCVAGVPTKGWATKVFPDDPEDVALGKLWHEAVKILRLNHADPIGEWREHNLRLKRRCSRLANLNIRSLRFVGPDTDLNVGISPAAIFRGGTQEGPRGVEFEPNLPTEECFTIPDYRLTEGFARATRPFLVNGTMVRDLKFRFKAGMLVDFSCASGEEALREYLSSDEGARRLGEVALVGIDSPVYQSGLVFREILFDENAACHVAIGMAYRNCLVGGETMSAEELREHGCNESIVHTDIMISSEAVSVIAKSADGSEIEIIDRGSWKV